MTEAAGGGTDTVRTGLATFTLAANVEKLTYTGAAAFTGIGNNLANVITGGSGADALTDGTNTAGNGVDTLIGGAGAAPTTPPTWATSSRRPRAAGPIPFEPH